MKNTIVVNFYGGPSAGKSTLAAQLFGYMKSKRMNVEYVPEFAKDLTWKKSECIDDQLYVMAQQHHGLYVLLGQVDYIITDSPILLVLHYINHANKKFGDDTDAFQYKQSIHYLTRDLYNLYNNFNYFVERGDREYIQAGRNQNEYEAKGIDLSVYDILIKQKIPFTTVQTLDEVIEDLLGNK